MKKRVCIDVNSILPLYSRGYLTGVGRTTYELISEFERIKEQLPFELMLYSQNTKGISSRTLGFFLESKHLSLPLRPSVNKILSSVCFRTFFTKADLWHCPHNSDNVDQPQKTIFTLHDMLMYTCPNEFPQKELEKSHCSVPKNMQASKAIITCSHSTKKDIIHYMDIDPLKIHVIHWGIDHHLFKPLPDKEKIKAELKGKYGIGRSYFFSVSCGYGRKNTLNLLRAYIKLLKNNPDQDLVILWKDFGVDVQELISLSKGRIHTLCNISNEELVKLYNCASIVFYPSVYEGFGLPILESMACGTPVVTCRNSSLEEVGGEVAIYAESEGSDALYHAMIQFEDRNYDTISKKEEGLKWAAQFTWEKCAEKTIEIYQKCLRE